MALQYVTVKGYIKDGELRIDLPENVVDGEVEIVLPITQAAQEDDISPEELLKFEGKTLGEIETGGWEGMGITDSAAWVEENRRKAEGRYKW
jgi:hypothetical protein